MFQSLLSEVFKRAFQLHQGHLPLIRTISRISTYYCDCCTKNGNLFWLLSGHILFDGHLSGIPYIFLQILKFLNGYIGLINTKLKDFVKLSVLFLNIWVLCC